MTEKDYIIIAKIIKKNTFRTTSDKLLSVDDVVDDFVTYFKNDNDRFDKERFIKACQ